MFIDKILGVRNYKSDKNEFYTYDFLRFDVLHDFLWEVDTGESDITPAGLSFIEKYFGFEELVKSFVAKGDRLPPDSDDHSEPSQLAWLKSLEPMQTITFIEQARGNIQQGASLNKRLMPPDCV